MKIYLDCYPCVVRHSLEASRMVTDDETVHFMVMNSVLKKLGKLSPDATPPEIATIIHRIIRKSVKNNDPYKKIKKEYNQLALSMYDDLKRKINESKDPILTAMKLAIAGNIIDFGASNREFNLKQIIDETLQSELDNGYYENFMEELPGVSKLLYIGDNSGEIVFDKLLVEEIKKVVKGEIYFVVRGKSILNDATIEDAKMVGLDKVVKIISDGYDAPAFIPSESSKEAKFLFESSDLVIAKGQGNYESLSEVRKNIYFLLRLKCSIVAKDIGGKVGDNILIKSYFSDN
ncbi:hypothetical protein DRQ09_09585 [candidate division KSB1 bacterium]|nr:MAG: hypothetical protein DRQ09_09585 [candidate division KSB1 bacterium]